MLHPKKFNRHVQYAWRLDPCELGLEIDAQPAVPPAPARPHFQDDDSEGEYLATEPESGGESEDEDAGEGESEGDMACSDFCETEVGPSDDEA